MKIRKACQADADALVTFNQAMALETEGKTLDAAILSAGVAAMLRAENKGFYLVAEQGQVLLGSLMVTFEWSDWRNANYWWIQSVYVREQNRRQGIYSALYREVQRMAEASENVCGYRLYVERDNLSAQRTYEALGMQRSHYLMFESQ